MTIHCKAGEQYITVVGLLFNSRRKRVKLLKELVKFDHTT